MFTVAGRDEGGGGFPSTEQPEGRDSDGDSCVATVPFSPPPLDGPGLNADDGQRGPAGATSPTESDGLSGESHRRRRMHGSFADGR